MESGKNYPGDDAGHLPAKSKAQSAGRKKKGTTGRKAVKMKPKAKRRRRKVTSEETDLFICDLCGKSFKVKGNFKMHRARHTGEGKFKCSVCHKAYPTSQEMTEHFRVHTGERPFMCEMCGKAFTRQYALYQHKLSHTGEKPYQCPYCDLRLAYSMSRHIKLMHPEKRPGGLREDEAARPRRQRQPAESYSTCPVCKKKILTIGLTRHVRRAHRDIHQQKLIRQEQAKPFACPLCGAAMKLAQSLRKHFVKFHDMKLKDYKLEHAVEYETFLNKHMSEEGSMNLKEYEKKRNENRKSGKIIKNTILKKDFEPKEVDIIQSAHNAGSFEEYINQLLHPQPPVQLPVAWDGNYAPLARQEQLTHIPFNHDSSTGVMESSQEIHPCIHDSSTGIMESHRSCNHDSSTGVMERNQEVTLCTYDSGIGIMKKGVDPTPCETSSVLQQGQANATTSAKSSLDADSVQCEAEKNSAENVLPAKGQQSVKETFDNILSNTPLQDQGYYCNTRLLGFGGSADVNIKRNDQNTGNKKEDNSEDDSDDDELDDDDSEDDDDDDIGVINSNVDVDKGGISNGSDADPSNTEDYYPPDNETSSAHLPTEQNREVSTLDTDVKTEPTERFDEKDDASTTDRKLQNNHSNRLCTSPNKNRINESKDTNFSCPRCRKSFVRMRYYEYHVSRCGVPLAELTCKGCSKVFTKLWNLKVHIRGVHPGQEIEVPQPKKKEPKKVEKFYCDECSKKFPSELQLESHKMTHKGIWPFLCATCGRGFERKETLKRHEMKHSVDGPKASKLQESENFFQVCELCGESFNQSNKFRRHMALEHDKAKYRCDICKKPFYSPSELKAHKRMHTGEKPFQCMICGQKFTRLHAMKTHQLVHSKEKNHTCSVCGGQFTLATSLRRHFRLHTGEKPYRCQMCGDGYTQYQGLAYHLETVHDTPKKDVSQFMVTSF